MNQDGRIPDEARQGDILAIEDLAISYAHAVDDRDWLRELVGDLTDTHEATRKEPWKVDDAPSDYLDVMLRGIIGVEIRIARIEGKAKLSQNRSEADRARVVAGLRDDGGDDALRMAEQIEGAAKS